VDLDGLWQWLAWRLPRRLVYWCAVRVGTYEPAGMTAEEWATWDDVPNRRFVDGLGLWTRRPMR
jgi:hypothetical protein